MNSLDEEGRSRHSSMGSNNENEQMYTYDDLEGNIHDDVEIVNLRRENEELKIKMEILQRYADEVECEIVRQSTRLRIWIIIVSNEQLVDV
jgi:hypothetical protein